VPSPGRAVSATHLEIKQVGTTVVVTDLKSTNGTIVLVPGNAPRSLRQGETVVVSPGTLMDLGDDVVVQVLSARAAGSDPAGRQP
jgi:pSer/pThr/pTyr-binding forkhead associated (FHA) protein